MIVGTVNLPERTDDSKRNLFAPAKRARKALRWAHLVGIDLLAVQESGTVLAAAVRRRWWASYAPPNSIIKGHRIGNGLIGSAATIGKPIARGRIKAPIPGRRRPLSLPERLVVDQATGNRVAVIVVHKPRNLPEYAATRRAIDRAIAARVHALIDANLPVIVLGDFNGRPPQVPGLKILARHKADAICGAGVTRLSAQVHQLDRISDHAALTVDLTVDVANVTARRLPKESK